MMNLQTKDGRLSISRGLILTTIGLLLVGACSGPDIGAESTTTSTASSATTQSTADVSPPTTTSPATEEEDARYGGILTTAGSDLAELDPHTATTQDVPTRMAYESLVAISPWGEIVSQLAESWTISEDGLVYEFVLQPGVAFHDIPPVNGRLVTAGDVAYSLNRVATGEGFPHTALTSAIVEYEVVDDRTIRLHLEEPSAPLIYNLASHWAAIIPPELAEGSVDINTTVIGTGPFMLDSFEADVVYHMVKNPNYWATGLPYLDGIDYLVMTDAQSVVAAFRAGQLDIIIAGPSQAADIERSNPDVQIQGAGANHFHILLNTEKPPFDDPRVRRAFHLAIDRQATIELGADGQARLMGIFGDSYVPFATPSEEIAALPGYRQPKSEDLDEARRLLAEAGYADGVDFTCIGFERSVFNHVTQLEIIQPQVAEVGLRYTIQPLDVPEWRELLQTGDFECNLRSTSVRSDPDSHVSERFWSQSAANYSRLADPYVDELIEAQRVAIDPNERVAIIRELEAHLLEAPAEIPVLQRFLYRVMHPYVMGYEIGLIPSYSEEFGSTWLDR